jgi:hypothetical protein
MKNNLNNFYSPFDSFFKSETFDYILLGLFITGFLFVLSFLYFKFYFLKKASTENKNKLKKHKVFLFFFSFGFFVVAACFLIFCFCLLNYGYNYAFNVFGEKFLRICFILFLASALGVLIYQKKKGEGFFDKENN